MRDPSDIVLTGLLTKPPLGFPHLPSLTPLLLPPRTTVAERALAVEAIFS
jgi:hypothetical protein